MRDPTQCGVALTKQHHFIPKDKPGEEELKGIKKKYYRVKNIQSYYLAANGTRSKLAKQFSRRPAPQNNQLHTSCSSGTTSKLGYITSYHPIIPKTRTIFRTSSFPEAKSWSKRQRQSLTPVGKLGVALPTRQPTENQVQLAIMKVIEVLVLHYLTVC